MDQALCGKLISSVEMDDFEGAEDALQKGANPNTRDRNGTHALYIATADGDIKIIDLLLKHGASASLMTRKGNCALATAVERNDVAIVDKLLQSIEHETQKGDNCGRYLPMAVKQRNMEMVNLLLKHGADINNYSERDYPPIIYAIKAGHVPIARILLAAGADPNVRMGMHDGTLLHYAIERSNVELVKLLLEYKANVNAKNYMDESILETATEKNNKEILDLLKQNGAEGYQSNKKRQASFTPVKVTGCGFSNVVGLERTKAELNRDVIQPLKNPELAKEYGMEINSGILLYGPPGCGKTFMVKATAGETGMNLIEVKVSEILDCWVGIAAKNMAKVFATARKNAPCIIFIDEIEMLGGSRSGSGGQYPWLHEVLSVFLTELDGIRSSNSGLLVVGATNAPWMMDPALKRSGRLGKMIFVQPPDEQARAEIFKLYLKDRAISNQIDYPALARETKMCTAADIKMVCNEALKLAWVRTLNTKEKSAVTNDDLVSCIKKGSYNLGEWYEQASGVVKGEVNKNLYGDFIEYMERYKKENLAVEQSAVYR